MRRKMKHRHTDTDMGSILRYNFSVWYYYRSVDTTIGEWKKKKAVDTFILRNKFVPTLFEVNDMNNLRVVLSEQEYYDLPLI
mgnify:CR=1 FL=1